MVDLDFKWATGGLYISGECTIKVTKENFMDFPMFDIITFKDKDGFPFFNFTIKTSDKKYRCNDNLRASLRDRHIFNVDVFVFKDIPNNPLLVRVKNGSNYQYFKIRESLEVNRELELKTAHHYSPSDFFEALIDENDKLNQKITFIIDKTTHYNSINITDKISNNNILARTHVPNNKNKPFTHIVLKGKTRVNYNDIFDDTNIRSFDHMNVYYRSGVKHSGIPLLVEFVKDTEKYYIYREHINQDKWSRTTIDDNLKLEDKLEEIETHLFYSVTVSIHEKKSYTRGVINSDTNSANSGNTHQEKIEVNIFNQSLIPDYVCYEHDLSIYSKGYIKQKKRILGDDIRTLFVNIFNTLIQFTNGETESYIFFVEEYPKFYVWFYKGYDNTNEDNLPLMIQYYNRTFIPKSKDEYLNKWIITEHPINFGKYSTIVIDATKKELDRINFMLNAIDLNHKIIDTSVTSKYGILTSIYLDRTFDTTRIRVNPESFTKLFIKCIHTTKNGFMIREAHYTKQIYHQGGSKKKLQTFFQVSQNSEQSCNLKVNITEATVYYFTYDPDSEYPLLVEYKLCDSEYEYHVLQCDFSQFLEYKIVYLTHGKKIEYKHLFYILRHQNFIFHNIVNIKLDRKTSYTCCDKKNHNEYLEFVPKNVRGVKHCHFRNEDNGSATKLPFINVDEFNNNLLYGYVVYEHSLKTFFTDTNKGPLGEKIDNIKIQGFRIKNSEIKLNGSGLEGPTFVRAPYVFVYFYRYDPRPLLVCYNHKAYAPLEQSKYASDWYPVDGVRNFIFKTQKEFNLLDPKLLDKLNDTVGFLNTVNLYVHSPDIIHTYDVHTFKGKKISVKVTQEALMIGRNPGTPTCYTKFTHTPNGINGEYARGFRLGNIIYNGNGLTGKLDYNKEGGKWYPLTSVSVYYYNYDIKYKDPLLVELVFENSLALRRGTLIDYYKLTCNDGHNMKWEKDQRAFYAIKYGGNDLINLLDSIRHDLKKVLKIELDQQAPYPLMLSQKQGDSKSNFTNLSHYQVEVEQCVKCSKIPIDDYKILQHKISDINGGFDYNDIGGIEFTLPGTNGKIIEISLKDSKVSKTVGNTNYNKCMGDVYVYFSKHSDPYDAVPLFIHFHNQWYTPTTIEEYFKSWSSVDESSVILKLDQIGGYRNIEECINKVKVPNLVTGLGVYSIELARSDSTEGIETTPVCDLETSYDNHPKKHYFGLETPYVYDLEMFPPHGLKMPSDNYIDIAPIDPKKPYIDIVIPPNGLKPSYLDMVIPSTELQKPYNVFEAQTIEHGFSESSEDDFSVQRDESQSGIYKVLNTSQDFDSEVKIDIASQRASDTKKHSKELLHTTPEAVAMSSTGLGSDSDDSNQSYLGSILGGTFGSLITIGPFAFMLFKYFRRVKIRNMIPNLY